MTCPRWPGSDGAPTNCSTPEFLMVPGTTGHFRASDAWRCKASANSAATNPKAPSATTIADPFGIRKPRGDEFGQPMQADRRAEHDRKHDHRSDSEATPQPLRQVALQHRLLRMLRIVVDHDDGPSWIFRDGLRHLEIAEVLADADAVVAQLLAVDGIFVGDVGEVALFDLASVRAVAVHHRDVAHLWLSRSPPCPASTAMLLAARTCHVL